MHSVSCSLRAWQSLFWPLFHTTELNPRNKLAARAAVWDGPNFARLTFKKIDSSRTVCSGLPKNSSVLKMRGFDNRWEARAQCPLLIMRGLCVWISSNIPTLLFWSNPLHLGWTWAYTVMCWARGEKSSGVCDLLCRGGAEMCGAGWPVGCFETYFAAWFVAMDCLLLIRVGQRFFFFFFSISTSVPLKQTHTCCALIKHTPHI